MSALGRVVRSGVGRRKVQTAVIAMATMLAVAASVLSGSLLLASNGPFETAFAEQHGSHLTAEFDASGVTAEQLADTANVDGVAEASGPYETVSITPDTEVGFGEDAQPVTVTLPPLTVVGRDKPGEGDIDNVTLMDGRWAAGPGEIVVSVDRDRPPSAIGTTFELPDAPGSPTLTVVGWARSISRTADAWVTPSAIGLLRSSDAPSGYQMLYRLILPDTADDVAAARDAIAAALPGGTLIGSHSWLAVKEEVTSEISAYVPFLIAFGVVGLALSVLIVGNVVAGAVSAGTRRIGILKSLGFTPGQVVRA